MPRQKLAAHKNTHREDVFRRPEFVDREGFYFLGKHYRLKLVDVDPDGSPTPTIRFEGDRLLFRREQVAAGEKRIAEYYRRRVLSDYETRRRWLKEKGGEL